MSLRPLLWATERLTPGCAAGGEAGARHVLKVRCVVSAGNERSLGSVSFLTVAEVAQMMRVSKMTVYRLVHAGTLPAVQVGRSYRVPEKAVHEYLEKAYVETA
jgi:excisionase family DNA binding protein